MHNGRLKFGTVARVFCGRYNKGADDDNYRAYVYQNTVSLCRTEQKVLSGKREIVKKMSTNLMFGFYYSLCWQTSRDITKLI